MSLATTLRFELNKGKKSLQKALQRQQDRVKSDEMMAENELSVKLNEEVGQKSNWNESLEAVAQQQRMKSNVEIMKQELALAGKATLAVRRAALKHLLEREHKEYEQQLHGLGKSFYIKRE